MSASFGLLSRHRWPPACAAPADARRFAHPGPSAILRPVLCVRAGSFRVACKAQESDTATAPHITTGLGQHTWTFEKAAVEGGPATTSSSGSSKRATQVMALPVTSIIRPLGGTRANDQAKVEALMHSIQEIGLQEPIDVLEVNGKYYGFSGCHRFEAHKKLGREFITCRVRKANESVLRMHMM